MNNKTNPTKFTKHEAYILLAAGAGAALLYAVCFSGTHVLPQISFTLFCSVVFILLTVVMKTLGRFKNKRALWWGLPIMILAVFNGFFHANPFTWGNALLVHALFAVYSLTAFREQPTDLFNLNGLLNAARLVIGDWAAIVDVVRAVWKPAPAAGLADAPQPNPNISVSDPEQATAAQPRYALKILVGVLIALPFMLIIIALLSSADAVFGILVSRVADKIFSVEWLNAPFIFSFILVWVYAVGYVRLGINRSRDMKGIHYPDVQADKIISATFLILVNAVFLLFTFIQIAFLFNGGFMTLPGDMVYSQYAREGFFQLLFVTVINFSVILVFISVLSGVKNSPLLKGLLLALCVFTGVLITSSFYRMGLYTSAYGHTTLRLWVYTFLAMEVVLLGVTVHKLFDDRVHYIKRIMLTGLAFYLLVNITGSDWLAAQLNVRMYASGRLDYIDVLDLGPDGLRVVRPLFENGENICADHMLMRKSDYPEKATPDATESDYHYYEEIKGIRENGPRYWQNWSYLKYRP